MITALSKDGKIKRKVIYNEVILMIDKYDSLSFQVKDDSINLDTKVNFDFSDSGDKYGAKGNVSDDYSDINITLINWYSSSRVENTAPVEVELKSGKKIWLKYGTSADERKDFRMFHLTIWGEVKP